MTHELEYLEEALEEAEAAARWHAERSAAAAVGFSEEVYRIEPKRILIVAVAHGRRRPGYWKPSVPGWRGWDGQMSRARDPSVVASVPLTTVTICTYAYLTNLVK